MSPRLPDLPHITTLSSEDLLYVWRDSDKPNVSKSVNISNLKLSAMNRIDVADRGAVCDGITDDTAAIQEAINEGLVNGKEVFISGLCLTSAPLAINGIRLALLSNDRYTSGIINNSSNVFNIESLSYGRFESFGIFASGGHIFNSRTLSQTLFHDLLLRQTNVNYSIFNHALQSQPCGYVDNVVNYCSLQGTSTHTVPLWKLNINANRNTFKDIRVTYSGNYVFWIENTGSNNYTYDNVFDSINFEVCNGGLIKLLGAQGCTIRDCHTYDAQAIGPYTEHLIYLGKNPTYTNLKTIGTLLFNTSRRSGTLDAGIMDVYLNGTDKTTMINCINVPDTISVTAPDADDTNLETINCNLT